jgi:hypothetical protein
LLSFPVINRVPIAEHFLARKTCRASGTFPVAKQSPHHAKD